MSDQLARAVLECIADAGVRELCVCPGKRNTPFISELLKHPQWFRVYSFFEERCAAFFALGRIQSTQHPVGVMTTSGTAVAELLPATMEAYYSCLPLVLLTADRPRCYRGTGAPQSAKQVGIFGYYVEYSLDWEVLSDVVPVVLKQQPIHWNICFDEPFETGSDCLPKNPSMPPILTVPKLDETSKIKDFFQKVHAPLVIVGALPLEARTEILELLLVWQLPVYCENLSGLREVEALESLRVRFVEDFLNQIDSCIRIGGVPTLRFWRDLELHQKGLPVLSLTTAPFSGLSRPSTCIVGTWSDLCRAGKEAFHGLMRQEVNYSKDRLRQNDLEGRLREEPHSEPGLIFALSERLPLGSRIFLGNSLPIREWDLAATLKDRNFEIGASRGMNGIDGQLSTYFGFAKPGVENWGIFGDLTTLYDLAAPWILKQLDSDFQINLVIIHNGGGKIFPHPFFQNQHQLQFRLWAEFWGLPFLEWTKIPEEIPSFIGRARCIQLSPEEQATQRVLGCI